MPEALPFEPSVPHQRIEVALTGISIVVEARWNDRDQAYYLDFWEADGITPIIRSVKVVLGAKLARTTTHQFLQGRALVAWDKSGEHRECGLDDLGQRVVVLYLTERDVALLKAPPKENRSDVDPV